MATPDAPHVDPQPSAQTDDIVNLWAKEDSSDFAYFEAAESDDWVGGFWAPTSPFQRLFAELDLESVLELASGQGRHSAQFVDRCGRLVLTDTSRPALDFAEQRFAGNPRVSTVQSLDGMTIPLPTEQGQFSTVFSFDALVHFELECIASYLGEIARLLRPGGRALLHHSNYTANPGGTIQENPSWRNFMSLDIMAHLASRRGLHVVVQQPVNWQLRASDGLTLLEKPHG